jgi:hypothetical protein
MDPYRVIVVLDREYGEHLSELPPKVPVWIVDTPLNRAAAQKSWAADSQRSHLVGVTTFKTRSDSSPEEALVSELDTIDLHHGIRSANPPYTVLEVVGTNLTVALESTLSQLGFNQFEATPRGFCAMRPLSPGGSPGPSG